MRNKRFNYLGINTEATKKNGYLDSNEWLKYLTSNNAKTNFLELNTLPFFDHALYWLNKLTYYDEHHLNEVGVKEYAIQALPKIKELSF